MLKTVQQLSQIPIKFGRNYYLITPRIIRRWCQNEKIEYQKTGKKKYWIEEETFIEYARFHYFKRTNN